MAGVRWGGCIIHYRYGLRIAYGEKIKNVSRNIGKEIGKKTKKLQRIKKIKGLCFWVI